LGSALQQHSRVFRFLREYPAYMLQRSYLRYHGLGSAFDDLTGPSLARFVWQSTLPR
jgi:hypothetical protein